MNDIEVHSAQDLPLILLPNLLSVCQLQADARQPDWIRPGDLLALIRTKEEFTVVCEERLVPPHVKAERGWRAFRVDGTLDFSMIGVLAGIAEPLAQAGVSIFVVSTYQTDYILVKEDALDGSLHALDQAGYLVLDHVRISS